MADNAVRVAPFPGEGNEEFLESDNLPLDLFKFISTPLEPVARVGKTDPICDPVRQGRNLDVERLDILAEVVDTSLDGRLVVDESTVAHEANSLLCSGF